MTRERLLGDTFNCLARNIAGITIDVTTSAAADLEMGLSFPTFAKPPMIERAEIDWGVGQPAETMAFSEPQSAATATFAHVYAQDGDHDVSIILYPTADAAPIHINGTVTVTAPPKPPTIYLPLSLHGMLGGDAPMPTVWLDRR